MTPLRGWGGIEEGNREREREREREKEGTYHSGQNLNIVMVPPN